MSALSSLFTPSGTHAAQSQQSRQKDVAKGYGQLFDAQLPQALDWTHILGALHLGSSIGNSLNNINAGPERQIQQYGAGAQEHAAQNSNQLANTLRGLGFGDGAISGATAGQFQNAATQTNQFAANAYSPEEQQQQLMALIQAIMGGNQAFTSPLAGYAQGVYGEPQVQVQPGLGQILGNIAGNYASAYTGAAGAKAGK